MKPLVLFLFFVSIGIPGTTQVSRLVSYANQTFIIDKETQEFVPVTEMEKQTIYMDVDKDFTYLTMVLGTEKTIYLLFDMETKEDGVYNFNAYDAAGDHYILIMDFAAQNFKLLFSLDENYYTIFYKIGK